MAKKEVLLLFSGGKDSFLSACYLIEEGFKLHLVTFENGAGLSGHNAEHGAKRLIERYGKNSVDFIGIHNICGIWRTFLLPYLNMKPSEIRKEYGELTTSQFNCLTCRTSMYIWSILKAKQLGIKIVADGARKSQGFVIELPNMIERFKKFFSEFSIELMYPVYELKDDWKRKNLILIRGFIPKTLEPQCLIGAPLPNGKAPDEEIQKAIESYFEKIVKPRAKEIIKTQTKILLDGKGEL